jgi:hypothetical protein
MNRLLAGLATVALATLSSCFLFSASEAEKIEQMTPSEFEAFSDDVGRISAIAGRRSAQLIDDAEDVEKVVLVVDALRALLAQGSLIDTSGSNDMVRLVISRVDQGSTEDLALVMQDIYDLVEITVGQIRIGIDGVLSPRQIALVQTILAEFRAGLLE